MSSMASDGLKSRPDTASMQDAPLHDTNMAMNVGWYEYLMHYIDHELDAKEMTYAGAK